MATYITPAWTNGASPAISAANLLAMGYALEETQHPYAPCSTAAGTAAKTATISNISNPSFSTFLGLHVIVRFQYANTAANPTLNINNTGDLPIYNYGSVRLTTWKDGQFFTLVYRSSAWYVVGTCDTGDYSKSASGSYTGTGTYGSSNKNTIPFSFTPKMVVILDNATSYCNMAVIIPGIYGYVLTHNSSGSSLSTRYDAKINTISTSISSNTLSWYSSIDERGQMNSSGKTYYWVAIG